MKKIVAVVAVLTIVVVGVLLWRASPPTQLAHYQNESFRLAAPDLSGQSQDETYYALTYPLFESERINRFLMKTLPRPKDHSAMAKAAQKLIDEHRDYAKDTEQPMAWFEERRDRVLQQTPTYIAFQSDSQSYTGGAHGNYSVVFVNYDVAKDRRLAIGDVLQSDKVQAFTDRAEQRFRAQEGLAPGIAYDERYFFNSGRFSLTPNFVFNDEGILFLYNIYEIKAYSEGQTELLLPYAEINDLLNDTGKHIRDSLPTSRPARTE